MIRDFAARAAREIDEHAAALRAEILRGAYKDLSEYKHAAGQLRGLEFALQTITDLAQKAETDD